MPPMDMFGGPAPHAVDPIARPVDPFGGAPPSRVRPMPNYGQSFDARNDKPAGMEEM